MLGIYTNFVNLLDLAGFACPVSLAADGRPFGVTFLAPAGHDAELASLGAVFQAQTDLPLGALGTRQAPWQPPTTQVRPGEVTIAVVGAHGSGMRLDHELTSLDARFLETTKTTSDYQLFALGNAQSTKPGLLRVPAGSGFAIELETWAISAEGFGRFAAAMQPPLSVGSIRLGDGRLVKGILVEAEAVAAARNISSFGN